MALKSTVYKADVQISDMDRNYYQNHTITIARHPSETDERMMMRLLAFLLNASENLIFANGLTSSDEPDLWEKDLTGSIALWIMVGLPDEKLIKKACSRSHKVIVYTYGGSAADNWWSAFNQGRNFSNLTVVNIAQTESVALAGLANRSMKFQATIQDGIIWISSTEGMLEIGLNILSNQAY
jgi:uncharacterized protein YaeQ